MQTDEVNRLLTKWNDFLADIQFDMDEEEYNNLTKNEDGVINIPEEWESNIENGLYDKIVKIYYDIRILKKENPGKFYISGPSQITTLINPKTNQRIILFGEAHGHEGCNEEQLRGETIINIVEYFKSLFNTSTHKIDFYLEAPILHLQTEKKRNKFANTTRDERYKIKFEKWKKENKYSNRTLNPLIWLFKLEDELRWCIDRKFGKNLCPFKNVRVHSTDLRGFTRIAKMCTELTNIYTQKEWDTYKEEYKKEINDMSGIHNCNDYIKYVKSFFNKDDIDKPMKSILKQLSKSSINSDMLDNAMLKVCNSDINPLSKLIPGHEKIKTTPAKYAQMFSYYSASSSPISSYIKSSSDFIQTTQSQLSILVDIYTFLRMLRPFKEEQKYVIFYGGIQHCENIRIMLKSVDFIDVPNKSRKFGTSIIGNLPRCVEMIKNPDIFDYGN
jgi:hypothetical protein